MRAFRVAALAGLATWLPAVLMGQVMAAQIALFSANGVKAVVADLVPQFERSTGHTVSVSLGEAGELRRRILDGERCDVAFLPSAVLEDLAVQGKIAAGTAIDVARTEVGMAVRAGAGAAKPDASSPDAFKRALLAAGSIVITDPASGGVSGVHFAGVVQQLGIADAIKPKLTLTRGVLNAGFVARGEADLAIQLAHEIRAVPGVEFVALPAEFRRAIVFAVGVGAGAGDAAAARAMGSFLSGPVAAAAVTAHGMETPRAK